VNRDLTLGNPGLRRLIALRYLDAGCAVPAEEIMITSGGREAAVLALRALTNPGDAVAIETPSEWPRLAGLAALGLQVKEISTHCKTGVDLAALEAALKSRSVKACLVTPTFQSPLGSLMPNKDRRSLAKLVAHYGVPLIEYDPAPELYFDGAPHRPIKAYDSAGEVIHCGSFTTAVAPAYKIGWIAAGRYRQQVERAQMVLSQGAASACQAVMAEYLAHGAIERNFRRLRGSLSARRDSMIAAIADHFPDGCRMTRPSGGSLLWVELPKGTNGLMLYQRASDVGISIAPGILFSARQEYGNFLRLNYGFASIEHIHDGIRRIAALIPGASPQR
jgi:DNA-binding transcriptional MocR family regulator